MFEINERGKVRVGYGNGAKWKIPSELRLPDLQQVVFLVEVCSHVPYTGLLTAVDAMAEYVQAQAPVSLPVETTLQVVSSAFLCDATKRQVMDTVARLDRCTIEANQTVECLINESETVSALEAQLRACQFTAEKSSNGLTTSARGGSQRAQSNALKKKFEQASTKLLRLEMTQARCDSAVCRAQFDRQQSMLNMNHLWARVLPRVL